MHLKHLLKSSIVNNPSRFKDPEFRFVREFVTIVENHRDKYPPVMGDKQYNDRGSSPKNTKFLNGTYAKKN
jgi:hypothetical protein